MTTISLKPRDQVQKALSRMESFHHCEILQKKASQHSAKLRNAFKELQSASEKLIEQNEELTSSRLGLEDELRRYRELFEFTPDGYLVTDTEGIIIKANSAAAKLFKVEQSFLVCKPIELFIHSKERSSFKARLAWIKDGSPQLLKWEFTLISSNRTPFPAALTVELVDTSTEAEVLWLLKDITSRRQAESELIKEDKLESLGILAGGIAHDFNNYLTVVLGNLSLAKMYSQKDDRASKYLFRIEKAIGKMRSLTEQLLSFAKGGKPLTKSISIGNLIEEVCTFALSGSRTSCEFSMPNNLPPIEADSGQITQVLSNLLINADQSMPAGGTIKVSASTLSVFKRKSNLPLWPGKYVAITITDQGTGISAEELPRIFDSYFSTKDRGSGLGLTICYSIIKEHGGHISVETVEGEGSIFTIYLPVSKDKVITTVNDETLVFGEGKVLFMDDENNVRQTAGEMLNFLGYDVDFASEGNEAVRLYKEALNTQKPYDAVITDLTIRGGMGGKNTLQELLLIDPDVKAIVSSGYSTDSMLSELKKFGFCDVVVKPYKLMELGEVLDRVIKQKKKK